MRGFEQLYSACRASVVRTIPKTLVAYHGAARASSAAIDFNDGGSNVLVSNLGTDTGASWACASKCVRLAPIVLNMASNRCESSKVCKCSWCAC